MDKLFFIIGVAFSVFILSHADDKISTEDIQKIVPSLRILPRTYLQKPGDWFHITYGTEGNRIREEMITVHEVLPNEPKMLIVGFVVYKHKDGKLMVDSYVGNEVEVRIIGSKEIQSSLTVDALQLAEEFGWLA